MHTLVTDDGISRRRFLGGAAATFAAAGLTAIPASDANRSSRRPRRRQTVAVFGGGIAGLTAAHELAERGFDVTVYERAGWGGRIRGGGIPGTGVGGRRPLPQEHSWHGYFGIYLNLADTLRRIPSRGNVDGVFGNLVDLRQATFGSAGRRDLVLPLGLSNGRNYTPDQIRDTIVHLLLQADLPPDAVAYFADRMVVYLASCDARRSGELERTPWSDFVASDRYTRGYRELVGECPQILFASKPERTSAKFVAWVLMTFLVYNELGFGNDGAVVRVLDAPVDEALINPWLAELRARGVRLKSGHELTGLRFSRGLITGARLRTRREQVNVRSDWYILALPMRQARRLLTARILAADERLTGMRHLETANANGIQYYLRTPSLIAGVYLTVGQPWAPVFIDQAQVWAPAVASTYGDGTVHDVLSVAIANWNRPGLLYDKPVAECTRAEVALDTWEQIKRIVNKPGDSPRLTDDMLVSWHVDDAITTRNGKLRNEVPLNVPIAGTERYRPDVATKIPNLMLCGDYVKGEWEIAQMEAANLSGRRAANAVLDASGSRESRTKTIGPYNPPEWEPLRRLDEDRYRRGQPNVFDADPTATQTKELLQRIAKP